LIGAEAAIAKGYAAYRRGDLDAARAALTPIAHVRAWHLLGIVERQASNLDDAAKWLAKAAAKDETNSEIANVQGRVALDAGLAVEAEAHFRRAIALQPDWEPALTGLARSLNDQLRWHEAKPIWDTVLAQVPDDIGAQFSAAMVDLETGQVEAAETVYSDLLNQGVEDAAIYFMRGRARLEACRVDEGLVDLETAWAMQPEARSLKTLANALWMAGNKRRFEAVLRDAPDELALTVVEIIGQSGDVGGAMDAWARMPENARASATGLAMKAGLHRERHDGGASFEAAQAAYAIAPHDAVVADAMAAALMMRCEGREALKVIEPFRRADPHNQDWLAMEATALRLMGDARYDELVQMDNHVRVCALPVPDGFATIEAFNAAFVAALAPVRGFRTHPLDQSLRLGVQTSRDLVTTPDPVIQAYIKALKGPIQAYVDEIGCAPAHPLTARNTGKFHFKGCWSVKLTGGGRHVNHVHPDGWISSAYYASVPEETAAGEGKAGWLKFGEPPFATSPELQPQKWVQPKAGMLVLFPSYLWHGTEPIGEGSVRVTAPFDVVPI
jgi:predicted Zn-dependent protease